MNVGERRTHEIGARDSDNVQGARAGKRRATPKQFAQPAFGAVAFNGATYSARRNDAEPIGGPAIRFANQDQEPAGHSAATILDGNKFPAAAQARVGAKASSHVWRTACS